MKDERIEEIIENWDELLESTEYALWGEGDFDQEQFRETMFKTWKLFSERVDFDSPDDEYSLSIGMAEILGKIMIYSEKQQIKRRKDGGSIELSAMIAGDLFFNIKYRHTFSRNDPVVSERHMIDGEILRLTYLLNTGELRIESGHSEGITDFAFDPEDESLSEIKPKNREPIIVSDISRWWNDEDEYDEDEEEG